MSWTKSQAKLLLSIVFLSHGSKQDLWDVIQPLARSISYLHPENAEFFSNGNKHSQVNSILRTTLLKTKLPTYME